MERFNFNELPEVVRQLFEMVENIEVMMQKLQPAENNELDLMDVTQAATHLKITPAALYTKVSRKEIQHSKVGRRLYFSHEDLKNYIASGKRKTSAEIAAEANSRYKNYYSRNSH